MENIKFGLEMAGAFLVGIVVLFSVYAMFATKSVKKQK